MRYLALGDSISIDDYTGVPGGGAASQFARMIEATEFDDRTRDGQTTMDVLETVKDMGRPDIVTVTVGGNDFLLLVSACHFAGVPSDPSVLLRPVRDRLAAILGRLADLGCPVIVNTVYDPSDGDDRVAEEMGIPAGMRVMYHAINESIQNLAADHGFLLADLRSLFLGHGVVSGDPWIVDGIEPNLAGASAIAREWHRLITGQLALFE